MPVNIEIKALLRDRESVERRARSLADGPALILHQEDTFFPCRAGRLKLRIENENLGHLIFYERPDGEGPKPSRYHITVITDPGGLKAALIRALGKRLCVRKERTLYLRGRTRIHLDRVEDLGDYMELEVVLGEHDSHEKGKAEAKHLMTALGIPQEDLVEGAYADLLKGERT